MLKKIDLETAEKYSKILNRETWFSNPYNLYCEGYYEEVNKETLIHQRDSLYTNDFPYLHLPKSKELCERKTYFSLGSKDVDYLKSIANIDFEKVLSKEYFYNTSDFSILENTKRNFRKEVLQFQRKYKFDLLEKYSKNKIIDFVYLWKENKKEKTELFETNFKYQLSYLKEYDKLGGKAFFIEINGELAGYSIGYKLNNNFWIGVAEKANYEYDGINRFLFHTRANYFKDIPTFCIGTDSGGKGIANYKESLHPIRTEDRYYISTGNLK